MLLFMFSDSQRLSFWGGGNGSTAVYLGGYTEFQANIDRYAAIDAFFYLGMRPFH